MEQHLESLVEFACIVPEGCELERVATVRRQTALDDSAYSAPNELSMFIERHGFTRHRGQVVIVGEQVGFFLLKPLGGGPLNEHDAACRMRLDPGTTNGA